jgi:hypothetical protein
MIFRNPAGAPELACNACRCRWFDRMKDACYECGEPVSAQEMDTFARALAEWHQRSEERSPRPSPG